MSSWSKRILSLAGRAALLGIVALGLLEQGAHAQSAPDRPIGIFGGYTFSDTLDPSGVVSYQDTGSQLFPVVTYGRLHNQGGDIGVYVTQNRWLRWRVDATIGGRILGSGADYELAGPEFTVHAGPAVLFAHALFGRGNVGGGLFASSRDGFAMGFGGGADLRVTSWFSVRLIDADYLPSYLSGLEYVSLFAPAGPRVTTWENNSRFTFGVVFKAGKKK